ncbi:MAG: NAD-dependent epimerase/dehydratase family protein [Anaerolineae bacterium]
MPRPDIQHVLVTGAAGHIGRIFRDYFGDLYRLRLADRQMLQVAEAETKGRGHEVVTVDMADFDGVVAAMMDIDAVVHLAADTRIFAPWDSVLPNNIEATYNVFEASRECGVRKVVFASSHHACGYALGETGGCGGNDRPPIRPDGLYGVSKIFGEALGRLYADRFGISVICLRIGWCHGDDDPASQEAMVRRMQQKHPRLPYGGREQVGLWISSRDMAQLIHRSIQADVLYGVYYAASDNEPTILDISRAREELGYEPEDRVNDYITLRQREEDLSGG